MPQAYTLYDSLTPLQLLTTYCKLFDDRADEANIRTQLESLGLPERAMTRPVESLSGGQRKRVSIAVELIKHSKIIFLDEPDSGLDKQTREGLHELLRAINEQGITIILTTHYQENIVEGVDEEIFIYDDPNIPCKSLPSSKDSIRMFRKKTPPQPLQQPIQQPIQQPVPEPQEDQDVNEIDINEADMSGIGNNRY